MDLDLLPFSLSVKPEQFHEVCRDFHFISKSVKVMIQN